MEPILTSYKLQKFLITLTRFVLDQEDLMVEELKLLITIFVVEISIQEREVIVMVTAEVFA